MSRYTLPTSPYPCGGIGGFDGKENNVFRPYLTIRENFARNFRTFGAITI